MMKLDYGRQIIAAGKVNAKHDQNQKAKGKYQKAKGRHLFFLMFEKEVPSFCLLPFAF